MAISVVMPYWDRLEVASDTIAELQALYGRDIEIILVDDGSPSYEAAAIEGVRYVRLPTKAVGLAPAIPINVGVMVANHDIICLSLPEIRHDGPILYKMFEELSEGGPDRYVMAQVYCESLKKWLCTPTGDTCLQQGRPEGTGLHFCVLFNRSLWDKTGGFDRDYRYGAAYEDTDFVYRLMKAGAEFYFSDAKATHTRSGAQSNWIEGGHARNAKLLAQKWNL